MALKKPAIAIHVPVGIKNKDQVFKIFLKWNDFNEWLDFKLALPRNIMAAVVARKPFFMASMMTMMKASTRHKWPH